MARSCRAAPPSVTVVDVTVVAVAAVAASPVTAPKTPANANADSKPESFPRNGSHQVGKSRTPEPTERAAPSKRGRLVLVATPIGNLADLSARAVRALVEADAIACEDTRTTGNLLRAHGIARPMTPYHEHNAAQARPALLARLERGETLALVSDAGTPLIADPGFKLVREAIARGIGVTAVPGPSAPLMALVLSGLPTDRFFFAGFLPPKTAARRTALSELKAVPGTLVVLEAPQRLAASLADMADVLGDRPAAVARELTKIYEEVRRGALSELARAYAAEGAPKGEIVVVVGAAEAAPETGDVDALLDAALASASLRDAADAVAKAT
ncbi:MAG: 16S rRNA (cytidine(1402)-2'-O)-methyltransferase, partial [Alphaproteobacteria bacterium]|nr:16S rRNA (cytidine(1402)-2'-O)-methyltransferase [Alphaproteobacteria bacterium]